MRSLSFSVPSLPAQVLSQTYQLLLSVFQSPAAVVAVSFIQALGGALVGHLQAIEKSRPQSTEEVQAVLAGIRALETLVSTAEEEHREYEAMLPSVAVQLILQHNYVSRVVHHIGFPVKNMHCCTAWQLCGAPLCTCGLLFS